MSRFRIRYLVSERPIADFLPTELAAKEKAIELDYAWRHDADGSLVLDPGVVIEEVRDV